MGKILKFCSSCDEGFAEKFTFCPDCGAPLQAFEMNPVQVEAAAPAEPEALSAEPEAPKFIAEPEPEAPVEVAAEAPAAVYHDEVAFASAETGEMPIIEEPVVEEPVIEEPIAAAAPAAPAREKAFMTPGGFLFEAEPRYADEVRHTIPAPILSKGEDGYSITVIEEKNVKQRNWLLLGSLLFMLSVAVGAWGVSLFQKTLDIGAIGDDHSLAMLIDDVPAPTDEIKEKKDKDEGGGGGGGGREEKDPTSQGDLADQTKVQTRPPDVNTPRSDTPLLPPPSTVGNQKFEKIYDRYGDPNSRFTGLSNGTGTGGGQGSGQGTGQGSGNGTGAGSGTGSGYGSGIGDGNGPGTGSGDSPPAAVAKVTQPLKILAKRQAQYTDDARTNNVQGSVTLKVTFLASGGIGNITTIRGLGYGLTEQAIAAARDIKFIPEMVNGVPRSTSRTVTYAFNIY